MTSVRQPVYRFVGAPASMLDGVRFGVGAATIDGERNRAEDVSGQPRAARSLIASNRAPNRRIASPSVAVTHS